jgi:hypothetical protein
MPIDDLEHGEETFDTVPRVDADLDVIGHVHGGPSWRFKAA